MPVVAPADLQLRRPVALHEYGPSGSRRLLQLLGRPYLDDRDPLACDVRDQSIR